MRLEFKSRRLTLTETRFPELPSADTKLASVVLGKPPHLSRSLAHIRRPSQRDSASVITSRLRTPLARHSLYRRTSR